jgi:antitoxin ParD1/3/4
MIKTRVAPGEYAAHRMLHARDAALEKFLREEAAKSYDEYKADPKNILSVADVSRSLDARHRARRTTSRKR